MELFKKNKEKKEKTETLKPSLPIGEEQIGEALSVLNEYKSQKAEFENRVLEEEKWYNMRHWDAIGTNQNSKGDRPEPTSAWLFNAIANKHADMMDNYPEPNILPREEKAEEEARNLSGVIPSIMLRCGFEKVYSDNCYQKLKHGTAVYSCVWNSDLDGGIGDVDVKLVDILNIYCDMNVSDIQESKNLFIVGSYDTETLKSMYPEFKEKFKGGNSFAVTRHAHQGSIDDSKNTIVIDWYYKVREGNKVLVHYVKFAENIVLFATENEEEYKNTGLYEHGKYPIVVDNLFPMPSSPFGFGMISITKSPQLYIDKLDQILLENAVHHAKPRYFASDNNDINESEFFDLSKPIVHVAGGVSDERLKKIEVGSISNYAMNMLEYKINEIKETAANNDVSNGAAASGVTSGAAISALQEAGNKQSRDMLFASYRSYTDIVYMVIELIRQFYTEERSFRVMGDDGRMNFIGYSNKNLTAPLENYLGEEEVIEENESRSYSVPQFDIDVKPQRRSAYSKLSQNTLAKELYNMGFFNPENATSALACIEIMDFDGKAKVKSLISEGQTLHKQLQEMQNMINSLMAAQGGITAGGAQGNIPPQGMEGVTGTALQGGEMPL